MAYALLPSSCGLRRRLSAWLGPADYRRLAHSISVPAPVFWEGSTRHEVPAMIVGIGMDVVEIGRIRDLAQRHAGFLTRTFAPCELHHCQEKANPFPHLAARFAAKEAVFKALGTGWSVGLTWTDVEVENNAAGKPAIRLNGAAKRLAEKLGAHNIHLSLTHTGLYAGAQVVLEGLPAHLAQSGETETASTMHIRRLPHRQTGLAR